MELVALLSRSNVRRVRQLSYPSLYQGGEWLARRKCLYAVVNGGLGEFVVDQLIPARAYTLDYYSMVHGRNLRNDPPTDKQRLEAEDHENPGGASLSVEGQHLEARYAIRQCI